MKHILLILLLLQSIYSYTQCVGVQSATINPPAPAGGYLPNTTVTVCYTMVGWPGLSVGANWLEGFSITAGPGWNTPQPVTAPADCNGGTTTGWLWMNSVTSTSTGQSAGPGYFYEGPTGPQDNNPGNDWGDQGNCTWTMCFSVTTKQSCVPLNLNLSVTAGADGTWGSWSNSSCPTVPYSVYSGNLNVPIVTLNNVIKKDTCGVGLGSIVVNPTSPTYVGPYTYTWNPNLGNTNTLTGLNAGTYTLQVGYNNGCIKTGTYVVGNVQPTYNVTTTVIPCFGDATGTATANMAPPIGNISYNWSNTQTTQTATNLLAGNYTCTISNTIGCTSTIPVTVTQNPQLQLQNLILTNATCADSDAIVEYNIVGGVPTYQYQLDGVVGGDSIGSLPGGNHLIHVTDNLGCTLDSTVYLDHPTPITPGMYSNIFELCTPGTFIFTNSSTPVSEIDSVIIHWGDNTDTTIQNFIDASHTYTSSNLWDVVIDVVSNYGCLYTDTIPNIVKTNEPPIANFYISPNPTTVFTTNVTCNDWSTGVPIQWQWVTSDGTPGISNQENPWFTYPEIEGNHNITLTVTDANGCWDTITKTLIIEHEMLVFVPNTFTPGGSDEFNNEFKWVVLGINESQFNMSIFNRFGEIIWETNDPNSTWDGTYGGKLVPDGQYVWLMTATNKLDGGKKVFNGTLNVLR